MRRILIIKPSSLGDIVHGLLVAQSIAEQAGPEIHWVAGSAFAPLVELAEAVDVTHIFKRRGGLIRFTRLLSDLTLHPYDAVLDMQGLARSAMMTTAARAPLKLGRADAREGAQLAYTDLVRLPPQGKHSHAVDRLRQFLPALGLEDRVPDRLRFRKSDEEKARDAGTERILLFPDSRRPEKEWPAFPELTIELLRSTSAGRITWAGARELPAPDGAEGERFENLTGRTPLADLVPLIQSAKLVVANDSGPMHLAAALGVPVLAIFGPTPPVLYGPYPLDRPSHRIVQAPRGNLSELKCSTVLAAAMALLRD